MRDVITSIDIKKVEFEYTNEGVITKPEFVVPELIYKYYSLNKNSIDALSKNYLYASHPYLLNDSADCSDRIFDFKDIKKEFYRGFYLELLKEEYDDQEIFELYKRDKLNNFKEFRETFVSYFNDNKFGIISLANNRKNSAMWSHYTSEKGFCIEFNTKVLLNNYEEINKDINDLVFRPMQYVNEIELLKITGDNYQSIKVPFLYLTTVKNKEWSYEKEFRINIYKRDMDVPFSKKYTHIKDNAGENNRYFKYRKSAIKSIMLGEMFLNNEYLKITNGNILEIEISEKSKVLEDFINLIFEDYNDRIFLVGITQENGFLQKARNRIFFERIYLNKFKIIYTDEKELL